MHQTPRPLLKLSLGTSLLDDSQRRSVPAGRLLLRHKPLTERKEAVNNKLLVARREAKRVVKRLPSQRQPRTILIRSQKMLKQMLLLQRISRRKQKRPSRRRKRLHQLPSLSSSGMSNLGVLKQT